MKEQQIAAKLANYDVLSQKVQIMEQEDQHQKAAANLMEQLIDAGLVQQDEDGSFMMPESQSKQKFKPFQGN